jgi:2-iminobutanoate/2-iminopropanoate deaminase
MREIIVTTGAPNGIGPFSQAIRANGFLFISGQVPVDPSTRQVVAGDFRAQAERVFSNLAAILEADGSSFDRVVRVGVFLKDMDDFGRLNEIYSEYFRSDPPARTTVQSSRLPKDVLLEIDAIALAGP